RRGATTFDGSTGTPVPDGSVEEAERRSLPCRQGSRFGGSRASVPCARWTPDAPPALLRIRARLAQWKVGPSGGRWPAYIINRPPSTASPRARMNAASLVSGDAHTL